MCSWLYGFLQWMMSMSVNFVSIVSHTLERNTNTYLSRSPEMEKSLNVTLTFSSLPAFISPSKKNRHTVFFGNSNGYPGELNVPLEPPVLRIRTSHSGTNNTHRWEHELARVLLFMSIVLKSKPTYYCIPLLNHLHPNKTSIWIIPIIINLNSRGNLYLATVNMDFNWLTVTQYQPWVHDLWLKHELFTTGYSVKQ